VNTLNINALRNQFSSLCAAILTGWIALAPAWSYGLTRAPESLEHAHDIVEVRLWVGSIQRKLMEYKGRSDINIGDIGAWPRQSDFENVVNLGIQAVESTEVDWRTLGRVLACLEVITPQAPEIVYLADKVVRAPLPETLDDEWYAVHKAMRILARQNEPNALALLESYEDPRFWHGFNSRHRKGGGAWATVEETRFRFRQAAIAYIGSEIDPAQGRPVLERIRKKRQQEPAMLEVVDKALETVAKRLSGEPEEEEEEAPLIVPAGK
jgi:hypothetical protein